MQIASKTLLLFSILFSPTIFAQTSKYEIGVEGGVTNDHYRMKDPLDNLRSVPCISGAGGVTLRKKINRNFFVETALLLKGSTFGFKLKQESGYSISDGAGMLMIPLRAGYSLRLSKKVSIAPITGVALAYKTTSGELSASSLISGNNSLIQYRYQEHNKNSFLLLLQGSVSLEIIILKKIRFSFAPGYYYGLIRSHYFDVDYTVDALSSPTNHAIIKGYGSFINYNFGFKYLLPKKK